MSSPFTNYTPPGPVIARFLASNAFIRATMGPVGSGKTGGSLMDPIYRAMCQAPHPADGVRRTKWAVIRDTYRQLEKTTIKSWNRWFPKELPGSHWVGGSGGQPATHTLRFALPDGTTVETIMEFIGLGENSAEQAMPGWEGTGAYLNEVDKLNKDVLTYVKGRVGRYPAVDEAAGFPGASWRGVWMDFNAPDTDHWLYETLVENIDALRAELAEMDGIPPELAQVEFFVQPPAMHEVDGRYVVNPAAENLRNLPAGYYHQQIFDQPKWYIRRMVLNRWGASRDGKPVYEEYSDDLHVPPVPLEPVPDIPLVIGADAGLKAAAIILQQMPNGQWRTLDELVAPEGGWGAQRFGAAVRKLLQDRYAAWVPPLRNAEDAPDTETAWRAFTEAMAFGQSMITGWADPFGENRSPTDEQKWMRVVSVVTGIPFRPTLTNHITPRLESVRRPLSRLIDGQPGLLISSRCKVLRKGFNSGYRLKRVQVGTSERYEDTPDKNTIYADPHDALQYALLGGGEYQAVISGGRTSDSSRQTEAITEDLPAGRWIGSGGRQAYAEID